MAFSVRVEGLEALDAVKKIPPQIKRKAAQAINRTARDQRVVAARRIGDQVALPKRLLGPGGKRLEVVGQASPAKLETKIRARGRPTSLARFIKAGTYRHGSGVILEVKPGRAQRIARAFPIRLRRGAVLTETQFNLGLAIRLRKGERLDNKNFSTAAGPGGLTLLYGPSIQQVFLDNSLDGVAKDIERPTADKLALEFNRLLVL